MVDGDEVMAALALGFVVAPLLLKDIIQEKELRLGSGIEIAFLFAKAPSGLKCPTF